MRGRVREARAQKLAGSHIVRRRVTCVQISPESDKVDLTIFLPLHDDCAEARTLTHNMAPPSTSALRALAALRSQIFEAAAPPSVPGGVRAGAKWLRKPLVGAAMLRYYPQQLSFKNINALNSGLPKLIDPRETQRLKDVERKKALGKGPPKKGE